MWEKMKKTKALVLAAALIGSVLLSTEATAATKITTGTSCTSKQKDKTTKVTSKGVTDTYRCTTNPMAKGAAAKKLVWVSLDCIEGDKLYKETIVELNKAKADPTVSQSTLTNAQSTVDSFKTIAELVCSKGY